MKALQRLEIYYLKLDYTFRCLYTIFRSTSIDTNRHLHPTLERSLMIIAMLITVERPGMKPCCTVEIYSLILIKRFRRYSKTSEKFDKIATICSSRHPLHRPS